MPYLSFLTKINKISAKNKRGKDETAIHDDYHLLHMILEIYHHLLKKSYQNAQEFNMAKSHFIRRSLGLRRILSSDRLRETTTHVTPLIFTSWYNNWIASPPRTPPLLPGVKTRPARPRTIKNPTTLEAFLHIECGLHLLKEQKM